MRGLPGSGKSSVSRAVTELLAAEGGAVACSADHFFERGGVLSEAELAGLGACERYRAAFRTDLLGEAHAQCRAAFDAALAGGVPLVVVDNTHSRRGEYDYYRAAAKERGYRLAVLELRCASTAEARSFHARCSHGVPWAVYESMLRRWEADEGAVLLAASPSVADGRAAAPPRQEAPPPQPPPQPQLQPPLAPLGLEEEPAREAAPPTGRAGRGRGGGRGGRGRGGRGGVSALSGPPPPTPEPAAAAALPSAPDEVRDLLEMLMPWPPRSDQSLVDYAVEVTAECEERVAEVLSEFSLPMWSFSREDALRLLAHPELCARLGLCVG